MLQQVCFSSDLQLHITNIFTDAATAGPLIDGVASDLEKNALSEVSNLPVFQNARSLIGDAGNIVSGLKNIQNDMSSGDPARINQHQDFLSKSFGTAGSPGQLQMAAQALSDFASHDWENEPTSSTSAANTATSLTDPSAVTSRATQSYSRSPSFSSLSTLVPSSTNIQSSKVSLMSTSSSSTFVSSSVSAQSTTASSKPSTSTSSCSQSTAIQSGIGARGEPNAACSSPQRFEYVFVTKEGTPIEQFESFIMTLPDQGNGVRNKAIEPILRSQLYATQLTVEEAAAIEAMDFIDDIGRNDPTDDVFAGGVTGSNRTTVQRKKRDDLPTPQDHFSFERTPSASHLRLLTQVPTQKNPDGTYVMPDKYTFDPTLGGGSTIYVIDTGFNKAHDVRQRLILF
jgi:hypothetical protein